MQQANCAKKVICAAIGKDKFAVSRELKRNSISTSSITIQNAAIRQNWQMNMPNEYANEWKGRFRRHRKFTEEIKG